MRLERRWLTALAAGCLLLPGSARGAGYGIYEQGAAVLGMAGAGTASVLDASAVFFNPAAMTRLEGSQIYGGGTLLQPTSSFAGVAPYPGYGVTEEMEPQNFYPPTLYFTHRYAGPWAVGLGLNSPFGLGVEWKDPDRFTGRYIVTKADLRVVNASLVAARELKPGFSVGAGGNLVYARVNLQNRRFQSVPGGGGAQFEVAKVELDSDFTPGYGWNAGLAWSPGQRWPFPLSKIKPHTIAASYRSKVVIHVDGKADFTQMPTGNATVDAAVAAQLPPDQGGSTVVRLPAIASAGLSWKPGGGWTFATDVTFTGWSVFEDLPIYFERSPASNEAIVEKYEDTFQIRAGAEQRLSAFTYRLGYYFDQAAAPVESVSPILPDADRHGATIGLGFGFGRMTLDLYELALFVQNRETDGRNRDGFDGEYKAFVNAAGFSLSYRW